MIRVLTYAAFCALILATIYVLNAKETNQGLPLVRDISPSSLCRPNPCDRVNCNRVNTRYIA